MPTKLDSATLNRIVTKAQRQATTQRRQTNRLARKAAIATGVATSLGALVNQANKKKLKQAAFVSQGQNIMRGGYTQAFSAGASDAWDDFGYSWDDQDREDREARLDEEWDDLAIAGDMVNDDDYMQSTIDRIEQFVDDHADFLAGLFAAAVGVGIVDAMSDASLSNRLDLYGGSAVSEYEHGYAGVASNVGGNVDGDGNSGKRHPIWHTSSDKDVCDLCDDREGQEYASTDDLEGWPGDGDFGEYCDGGPNCRCYLEWVDSEPESEDVQANTDNAPDVALAFWPDLVKLDIWKYGTATSGDYGHAGRVGERGGSAAGGGAFPPAHTVEPKHGIGGLLSRFRVVHDWRSISDPGQRASRLWQGTYAGAALVHLAMAHQLAGGSLSEDDITRELQYDARKELKNVISDEYTQKDLVQDANFAAHYLLEGLRNSGENDSKLFRGSGISKESLARMVPGAQVKFGPSSFTPKEDLSHEFLPTGNSDSPAAKGEPVEYVVDKGDASHAFQPVSGDSMDVLDERILGGSFVVDHVEPFEVPASYSGPGMSTVGQHPAITGTRIYLKQTADLGKLLKYGTASSGDRGHAGRVGERGGSAPGGDITEEELLRRINGPQVPVLAGDKSKVDEKLPAEVRQVLADSTAAALSTDGDAKSLFNGQWILSTKPTMMFADWNGTIPVRNGYFSPLATALGKLVNGETLSSAEATSARYLVGAMFHENVHFIRDDEDAGQRQLIESQQYRNKANRNMEEGTTELFTQTHYDEFCRAMGLDKLGDGVLLQQPYMKTAGYPKEQVFAQRVIDKAASMSGRPASEILDETAVKGGKFEYLAKVMLSGKQGDDILEAYHGNGGMRNKDDLAKSLSYAMKSGEIPGQQKRSATGAGAVTAWIKAAKNGWV